MEYDHNELRQYNDDGSHACETIECDNVVMYDDEPYCFQHSPNEGSHFVDYSYRKGTFSKPFKVI